MRSIWVNRLYHCSLNKEHLALSVHQDNTAGSNGKEQAQLKHGNTVVVDSPCAVHFLRVTHKHTSVCSHPSLGMSCVRCIGIRMKTIDTARNKHSTTLEGTAPSHIASFLLQNIPYQVVSAISSRSCELSSSILLEYAPLASISVNFFLPCVTLAQGLSSRSLLSP